MTQSIDLGRLRFYHRGSYNNGTTYELNDVVSYGGASYVYIYATNASGNLPTNATYWSKLADGLDHRGDWTTATPYYPGDVLLRGGSSYVAVTAHTSGTFATDNDVSNYWDELARGFRWRGTYATGTAYLKDDVVFYDGNAYIADSDFTSNASSFANDTGWDLLSQGGTGEIPAQGGNGSKVLTTDGTTVSWSNPLQIAADTGSTDVVLVNQTITFAGTANEITTAVSNNQITISQPDNVTVAANLTVSGTTASSNSATGAVTISGGLGVAGNTHIGANANIAGSINVTGNANVTSDLNVTGNAVVTGNLTVNGTTTTINTATLNVSDNIIILNNDVTSTPSENAGIEVERGTSTNVLIRWNETNDQWEWSDDGSTYTPFANAIVKTTLTAKGDIYAASANATVTRLAVGTNGHAIVANSSASTGLSYSSIHEDDSTIIASRVFG